LPVQWDLVLLIVGALLLVIGMALLWMGVIWWRSSDRLGVRPDHLMRVSPTQE
jgi:hypothetical protein